jgi:hypothetical protein
MNLSIGLQSWKESFPDIRGTPKHLTGSLPSLNLGIDKIDLSSQLKFRQKYTLLLHAFVVNPASLLNSLCTYLLALVEEIFFF